VHPLINVMRYGNLPFVQYSMYRGAMEPTWTSGGYPGGGCTDRELGM